MPGPIRPRLTEDAHGPDAPPLWVDRPMRRTQLTLAENGPATYDPNFWLDYFRRTKADAVWTEGDSAQRPRTRGGRDRPVIAPAGASSVVLRRSGVFREKTPRLHL